LALPLYGDSRLPLALHPARHPYAQQLQRPFHLSFTADTRRLR
jgi:hypothetical protein